MARRSRVPQQLDRPGHAVATALDHRLEHAREDARRCLARTVAIDQLQAGLLKRLPGGPASAPAPPAAPLAAFGPTQAGSGGSPPTCVPAAGAGGSPGPRDQPTQPRSRPRRPSPPAPPTGRAPSTRRPRSARATCGTPSPSAPQPRAKAIRRQRQHRGLLLRESLEHRASVAVAGRCCPSARARSHQRPADRAEVRACRDRHQAPRAALRGHETPTPPSSCPVAGRAGATTRRGSGWPALRTAGSALAGCPRFAAPCGRRLSYSSRWWGTPPRWALRPGHVLRQSRPDPAAEEPGEVPAGEHRPQQKQMRLLPLLPATSTSTSKKSISPRSPRPVDQRHEDLLAAALPLPHVVSDQREAPTENLFAAQQLVEPHGRQPLLAARPGRGPREQLLHPADHGVVYRPRPRDSLANAGRRSLDVSTHRVTGNAHLPGHLPGWHLLDEHLADRTT